MEGEEKVETINNTYMNCLLANSKTTATYSVLKVPSQMTILKIPFCLAFQFDQGVEHFFEVPSFAGRAVSAFGIEASDVVMQLRGRAETEVHQSGAGNVDAFANGAGERQGGRASVDADRNARLAQELDR